MQRGGVASQGSRRGLIGPGLALPIAVATAVVGAGLLTSAAQATPPPKNGKVTLCHATPPDSAKNGWVQITVSTNAVTHAGHGQHADDIIPAFTYYEGRQAAQYPGKNLGTTFFGSTGAQILANGCHLPARPTTEPPTPSSEPAPSHTHTHTRPAPRPRPSRSTSTASQVPSGQPATEAADAPASEPVRTRTVSAPAPAPVQSDEPVGPGDDESSAAPAAASYSIDATAAVRTSGGSGAAPAVAAHAGLAAGDTGDSGGRGSAAGMTAAIVGAAVAALAALGGLAYWRRRREAVDGLGNGPGAAG